MKKWTQILKSVIKDGGPSTCQFAITNVCNAACDFCNFSRDKLERSQSRWVSLEDGLRSLEILRTQDVGFMVFTGGEPTVHPNWVEFLEASDKLGMVNLMVSNGSTLSPRTVEKFQQANLSGIIVSIDSQDLAMHEKNRGLKGVTNKIKTNLPLLKEAGIGATASVTLNRLLTDFDRLPETLTDLGFEAVTFSFPLTSLESSYLGASESDLVTFTREELHQWIERVQGLKSKFPVLNPQASLNDMHSHLDSEPEQFPCLGGWKQFYLDWNLLLWRCNSWNKPMCHIYDYDGSQKVRDGCQACMVDCFRDASVQQYVALSLADGLQALRGGRLKQAWGHIMDRRNALSLGSALENLFWLKRV
ncbi:MAG: radical SAM protein [Vulcanimicrobiota bacterium]